jgi:anti-sigma regulatory factor (Ser/Thr protein kinase)
VERNDPPDHMREHPVEHEADVISVRCAAREFARALGFAEHDSAELAIVASELASNIVKYGVRGSVRLDAVDDPQNGCGVRLVAFDRGPAFHDFDMALRDGCDDKGPLDPASLLGRGGIGAGLGAVARLSDELGWELDPAGKRVWAIRYAKRPKKL